jgi:2-desacetyl-2-hydroxyethyl bacteriochlorophyllide A dehydrogenase
MKAVCIDAPGQIRLLDVPGPVPGRGEAIVDISYAGICGSDVELFAGARPADLVRYPVVPGHEWSGTVAAVGSATDTSLIGAKVVGEGFGSCRACARCADGEAVVCESVYDEIGFTRPGAWAQQLVIPIDQLHRLPSDADLRSAAALEPTACAADAVRRAAVAPGDRVAVVGGGTIGCLTVQLLRATDPRELVVIDPSPRAAAMALRCGATDSVEPTGVAEHPGGFDVVVQAAGAATALEVAMSLTRRGGRLVVVGVPDPSIALNAFELFMRRIELHNVFGAPHAAWLDAVDAFTRGALDPGVIVTHELELGAAHEALRLLERGAPDVGKVLLRVGPD